MVLFVLVLEVMKQMRGNGVDEFVID